MAITAVPIYSTITLASTASPTSPYGGVTVPVQVTGVAGNALAFNFIIATGSTHPGGNANLTFKYAFSMTDYSGSLATVIPVIANSGALFNISMPKKPSSTLDITTPWSVPILGNYLYCWLELRGFTAPVTSGFSASALPVASCTTSHTRN